MEQLNTLHRPIVPSHLSVYVSALDITITPRAVVHLLILLQYCCKRKGHQRVNAILRTLRSLV